MYKCISYNTGSIGLERNLFNIFVSFDEKPTNRDRYRCVTVKKYNNYRVKLKSAPGGSLDVRGPEEAREKLSGACT